MLKTVHESPLPSFHRALRSTTPYFLVFSQRFTGHKLRNLLAPYIFQSRHPREGGEPETRQRHLTYPLDSRLRGNDDPPRLGCGQRLFYDFRGKQKHSRGLRGGERCARRRYSSGFTLIELAIVVFLLGLVAAMSVPQLLPIIAFSELEGSARRVAGYGQGAMAHSALLRERIVVRIDLKEQQIYAVHWILPKQEEAEALAEEEGEPDQLAKLAKLRELGVRSSADLQEKFLGDNDLSGILGDDEGAFDAELAGYQMDDKFNAFAREALEVRADNVKHDDSFLDGVGDIFGGEEIFDLDKEEPVEEELADPILRRTGLRGDVQIVGVELDGEYTSRGVVEVEFSVLGLTQKTVLYIENEDGEAYTVFWDPVSNRSRLYAGRETDL